MKYYPSNFQYHQAVTSGVEGDEANCGMLFYVDTQYEHLNIIPNFFYYLSEAKLTISLTKTKLCRACLTFLTQTLQGRVGLDLLMLKPAISTSVLVLMVRKKLMCFLVIVRYHIKFCPKFSPITGPFTHLLSKRVKFE